MGIWGQVKASNQLLTCSFSGDNCLVGAADGTLQIWVGRSLSKAHKIHDKSVDSLAVCGNYIVIGSKDHKISILDKALNVITKVNCDELLKGAICPEIKSVVFSGDFKTLLVGTYGSEIYEIQTKDTKIANSTKFA